MDIPKTLEYLRPNASWSLIGDRYEDIQWRDTVQVLPTLAEMEAAQIGVEKMIVDQKRMDDYRRNSDPIFFQWQRGEKTKEHWNASVAAVRARHPNRP